MTVLLRVVCQRRNHKVLTVESDADGELWVDMPRHGWRRRAGRVSGTPARVLLTPGSYHRVVCACGDLGLLPHSRLIRAIGDHQTVLPL